MLLVFGGGSGANGWVNPGISSQGGGGGGGKYNGGATGGKAGIVVVSYRIA